MKKSKEQAAYRAKKRKEARAADRKALAMYEKDTAPARADYAIAMKAHYEARAACKVAGIIYERAIAPARAAYRVAIDKARKAYNQGETP